MTRAFRQKGSRIAVVEESELTAPLDPYLTLRALASYSSCSIRWLRDRLTNLNHPLPCYRLPGGKILVRRSKFDAWIARYRRVGDPRVEAMVEQTLAGLCASKRGKTATTSLARDERKDRPRQPAFVRRSEKTKGK